MSLQISVRSNVSQLRKRVNGYAREQIPFATSRALNRLAFDLRQQVVSSTYPRSLEVRNQSFGRAAFRVQKGNKRNLEARVYDRLGREFLILQARGGVRRAQGRALAVPTDAVKRTRSGRVSKRQAPGTAPRSFVITPDGRQWRGRGRAPAGSLVLQRTGKKRRPLRVLYTLQQRARVNRAFPSASEQSRLNRTVALRFPTYLRQELQQAVSTARR